MDSLIHQQPHATTKSGFHISPEKTQFATWPPMIHAKASQPRNKRTEFGWSRASAKAMASLATLAAVQPITIKGLAGSSISGTKLSVKPARRSLRVGNSRAGAVVAKYGDKSVYFDLEDLGNTTGQWDVYGSDAPSPYNSLQSKFFETFAAPFTKRGLLLKFLLLGGGSVLAYVSSTASADYLPIKKGPQLPPKPGPRGKI